jgi:WD repeat-containing protein 1 (actin-interacting protein 1)
VSTFLVRVRSSSHSSPASFSAASQPKSLAVASDGTVFIVEPNGIEAVRSNQKVAELKTKASPSAVAASQNIIAIGMEVILICKIDAQVC